MDYKRNLFSSTASLGANYTSDAWGVPDADKLMISVNMTGGTPNGTWKLQANDDPAAPSAGWYDVAAGSQAITSAADTVAWNIQIPLVLVRLVYTRASGTSTATITGVKQADSILRN